MLTASKPLTSKNTLSEREFIEMLHGGNISNFSEDENTLATLIGKELHEKRQARPPTFVLAAENSFHKLKQKPHSFSKRKIDKLRKAISKLARLFNDPSFTQQVEAMVDQVWEDDPNLK